MERLTNGQQAALEALCRTIVPAAFEAPGTADLPLRVAERIAELAPFHAHRARLALSIFATPWLPLLVIGRPLPLARLSEARRQRLLEACATHRLAQIRLLLHSIKRLVVHTHYGRADVRAAIGHVGPLHERATAFAWEGPLAGAGPVVANAARDVVHERLVPAGVIEGRTLNGEPHVRTRVCIIGSGVGGAMAAAILSEAGHDVVVLEEGGYHTAADFGDDETRALRTLYADNGLRSTDEMNVSLLQGRCAGGGSTVNWMVMLRTPEWVLDEWQTQHGTEDMSAAQMAAAFDGFERDSNVARVALSAQSPVNRLILDGCAKLGWSAHAASVNARDCMRVAACGLGCPYDAKQGALLTYLPRALQAGAKLYCDASVHRITRHGSGFEVTAIVNRAARLTVHADVVVLAAGAVGTPLLLQSSGMAGPAVGQHLRLHPTTAVVGLYDEPVYAATGIPLTAYCDEFLKLRDGYGHWIEAPPLTAGLAAVALPGLGARHSEAMSRFPHLAPLIVLTRDGAPAGPSVGSVSLRKGGTSIRYRLGSADRDIMLHGLESAARIHFACGARSVFTLHGQETLLHSAADVPRIRAANATAGDPTLFSAHVNGTCRIGRTPQQSGCRADGQVHGQPGLYVMDGSLLPTAPGVNPHETIAAVTSILARRLSEGLSRSV